MTLASDVYPMTVSDLSIFTPVSDEPLFACRSEGQRNGISEDVEITAKSQEKHQETNIAITSIALVF